MERVVADSCPGVLRPHLAADGALARLRTPGGALPVATLRGLRAVSAELADGSLGLTSRGNTQVRGVAPENVAALEMRLAALGMLPHPTHERVRNIVASPLSGRTQASIVDVDQLAFALDTALCARPDLVALPGRFLMGLDDGTGDIAGEEPDVLAVAGPGGRFEVVPFGAPAGIEVARDQVVEAVLAVATAFLVERQRQESKAWRVKELPGGAAAIMNALAADGYETVAASWVPETGTIPAAGLSEQIDGGYALCAVVPLGILNGEQLEAVAACCDLATSGPVLSGSELDGGTPLRITPWRRVVVRDLEEPAALAARELLAAVGLVVEPHAAWSRVTACAGRPGCAKSLTDVQADARAFAAACAPEGAAVHWAGCERACGASHGGVALLAAEGGYRVIGELGDADRGPAALSSIGLQASD
ncbi:hypothetical protein [Kineosporia sp. NBRC 101731]|uniref:hypothetical protein n=1 Tax=Kineosporia sp. NBRC 101731 TaxID=3032199 RepID=UPI0025522E79|nr:hypothetical protein [Kineosporia sp. NBRC 101731]